MLRQQFLKIYGLLIYIKDFNLLQSVVCRLIISRANK